MSRGFGPAPIQLTPARTAPCTACPPPTASARVGDPGHWLCPVRCRGTSPVNSSISWGNHISEAREHQVLGHPRSCCKTRHRSLWPFATIHAPQLSMPPQPAEKKCQTLHSRVLEPARRGMAWTSTKGATLFFPETPNISVKLLLRERF